MDPSIRVVGILGLVCIIASLVVASRVHRDVLAIIGGILLFVYSVALGDMIFTALQAIFTLVAAWDLWRLRSASGTSGARPRGRRARAP